jgi:hypothetical protein
MELTSVRAVQKKPWAFSVKGKPGTFMPHTPVITVAGNRTVVTTDNR